jgi:hypothetical protein
MSSNAASMDSLRSKDIRRSIWRHRARVASRSKNIYRRLEEKVQARRKLLLIAPATAKNSIRLKKYCSSIVNSQQGSAIRQIVSLQRHTNSGTLYSRRRRLNSQ